MQAHGPWKIVQCHEIYNDPYLQVRDCDDLDMGESFTDRNVRNATRVCLGPDRRAPV